MAGLILVNPVLTDRALGIDWPSGCVIAPSPFEGEPDIEGHGRVIVVDPRPEFLDDLVSRHLNEESHRIEVVVPTDLPEMLSHVFAYDDTVALAGLWVTDVGCHLELARSCASDSSAEALFRGFELGGAMLGHQPQSTDPDSDTRDEVLRSKYVSVLGLLQFVGAERVQPEPEPEQQPDEAIQQDHQELLSRIAHLQREKDALERKYQALANSRLGRITLQHWERSRKNA